MYWDLDFGGFLRFCAFRNGYGYRLGELTSSNKPQGVAGLKRISAAEYTSRNCKNGISRTDIMGTGREVKHILTVRIECGDGNRLGERAGNHA